MHKGNLYALYALSLFHIITISTSNYLVQIPVKFLGMNTTWGAFTFPFIFLTTDLTIRIYGAAGARKIIFTAMLPALLISYLFSVIFVEGSFQGLSILAEVNIFVARIAIASFVAYLIGQLIDIVIFNRLRQLSAWWIAPACSTFFGSLIDTISFFSIAFIRSEDQFMATNWLEIAFVDCGYKSCKMKMPRVYSFLHNKF